MPEWLKLEEFHISFEIAKNAGNSRQVLRVLSSRSFHNRLRTSIREAADRYSSLRTIRIIVSR